MIFKKRELISVILMSLYSTASWTISENQIRDALLVPQQFSDRELRLMDVNQDGTLDVRDAETAAKFPSVSFAFKSSAVNEASGQHKVHLSLDRPVSNLLVSYAISGSALARADFTDSNQGKITINGNVATITLGVVSDKVFEGNESLQISLLPSVDYLLGEHKSHNVTLLENETETSADYLFTLTRHLPNGAGYTDSFLGFANKNIGMNITFSEGDVVAAYIDESRSVGVRDNDTTSTIIPAKDVAYSNKTLVLTFNFKVIASALSTAASLKQYLYDPDLDDNLPVYWAEPEPLLDRKLIVMIENFDVSLDKLKFDRKLTGIYRIETTGLLSNNGGTTPHGDITGILQPMGVSR
ncbi:MAG: hypothetical protein KUF72_03685 [Candidatus Thiodiazotropha sp. (ex Ctena orbiculata)]|nr:hypothetical protein [Candidatus Thiodiazotropha taylori]